MFGQLVLHGERTDGIDFVAEEINTKREFAGVRKDVEDAAANGELPGLVNVIGFFEAEFDESVAQCCEVNGLSHAERESLIVQLFFRHHEFGQGAGRGYDIDGRSRSAHACEHFCAQYFVGGIALPVFRGPAIGRWEEQHALRIHHLCKIVVEVARFVGVGQYEECRTLHCLCYSGKKYGYGRTYESLQEDIL